MSLYVDSSALAKRYVDEPGREQCVRFLETDQDWVTARHTYVEVRRTLAGSFGGQALDEMRRRFLRDWERTSIVELDEAVCLEAASLAESTGVRTLDALHLAASQQAGGGSFRFLTYDRRQAAVARGLGWTVLGAE